MPELETAMADARIFGDTPMPDAARLAGDAGHAVFFSRPSPSRTDANQDHGAVVLLPGGGFVLVVADGVGGLPAGAEASRRAVSEIVEAVSSALPEGLRSAILDGFENANRAVRAMGVGAGTTLAVVEVVQGLLRPYHVGDSMILLVGQRGRIKHQSIPHSPVGYALESGLLDEKDAMVHEDRHIVSNIVGMEEMRIDVGPPLRMGSLDTVVLASDGLSDNLHVEEIVATVRKGPLDRAADRLARQAAERMEHPTEGAPSKPDDVTLILFRQTVRRGRAQ
jgi:serine/threonine protein phosphatase PrpC